jgi:hypothetical protein
MGNALQYAHRNYVYNSKEYDLKDVSKKLVETFLTKRQQQRALFMLKRVGIPLIGLSGAAAGLASFYYMQLNSAPVYHNYLIQSAYDSRLERHEKYLEENPKYLDALLVGYESLRPPKDELPASGQFPEYTRDDRVKANTLNLDSTKHLTPRSIQSSSFALY